MSTSTEKSIALDFAYIGSLLGKVPVLFVLDAEDWKGGKAFLHNQAFSAHPEEKEFLIGRAGWKVKIIKQEKLDHPAGPLEVTAIYMEE